MKKENWYGKAFAFFCNKECEMFPCHAAGDEDNFNCLFCYCPLYMLDDKCGGEFSYLKNGVKDCSKCTLPHKKENYGLIVEKFNVIMSKMTKEEKPKTE